MTLHNCNTNYFFKESKNFPKSETISDHVIKFSSLAWSLFQYFLLLQITLDLEGIAAKSSLKENDFLPFRSYGFCKFQNNFCYSLQLWPDSEMNANFFVLFITNPFCNFPVLFQRTIPKESDRDPKSLVIFLLELIAVKTVCKF